MKVALRKMISMVVVLIMIAAVFSGCKEDTKSTQPAKTEDLGKGEVKWSEKQTEDGFMLVTNEGGETLAYSKDSGVTLIQSDGFAFKDLNKNGKLDIYEDWRLDIDIRAKDLASQMPVEEIAGLMLHTSSSASADGLSDDAKALLDMGVRSLLGRPGSLDTASIVEWYNEMQAYVEASSFGIPVIRSTDPRDIGWPGNLAMAATFDPDLAAEAGRAQSAVYRGLGITTALGPQIDLATEPRWRRNSSTFGEDPALVRDMVRANLNAFQSTYDENGNDLGWGKDSVNAMMKHWPGDGPGESGRESHNDSGKFTVYPGGQYETHYIPFVDGGLRLPGKTEMVTAVMPSFSIAFSDTEEYGELVGSGYSTYKINDVLREQYGFDGVITTDWSIVSSKAWGVDDLSDVERYYKVIMTGVDQFGNVKSTELVIEAYNKGVEEIGEEAIRARFEESAVRVIKNTMNVGLFENPYLEAKASVSVVDNKELASKGLEAQIKSVVMVKNEGNVIKASTSDAKPSVYIPMMFSPMTEGRNGITPASWDLPVDISVASKYFNVVTDKISETLTGEPDEDGKATISEADIVRASTEEIAACDYVFVKINSPENSTRGEGEEEGTYIPLSLQYRPYTANSAYVRKESLAGDIVEVEKEGLYGVEKIAEKEIRSYFGETSKINNESDLDTVLYAAEAAGDVPVIVSINLDNPMVFSEFESETDAILISFDVDDKAVFEIVVGNYEPSGLLPFQMPKNMDTVEAQFEDVPRDMDCHVDSAGNVYDFAFGLDWSGVISDERTAKYDVPPIVYPENKGK